MRSKSVLLLVGLAGSSVVQLGAHHAIGGVYDEHRTMTIEGAVGSVLNHDPHPLVHLIVDDPDAGSRTWAVERDAASQLASWAVKQAPLRQGDSITVCGHPGRDPGMYMLRLLTLKRLSDGGSVASEHRSASECAS